MGSVEPREQLRLRRSSKTIQPTSRTAVRSFADMYDVHVHEVYRFVHRRCRDHQLAEDITQETFLQAIRSFDDPTSLSLGWLLTVARNRLYDVLRREVRYQDKIRLLSTTGLSETDNQLVERLRVERALGELQVDHRLVLTLHYVDGHSVPAMAEKLCRSVKSVEGLVTRARRALREQLEERIDGSPDRSRND